MNWVFAFSFFLSLPCASPVDNNTAIKVYEISVSPRIDGKADDECWRNIPFSDLSAVRIKICSDGENVYLLVCFRRDCEIRRHRPWKWDPINQFYAPGDDAEESIFAAWSSTKTPQMTDFWVWRSARTDPSGFADDCFFIERKFSDSDSDGMPPQCFHDAGEPCWLSRFFAKFAGEELPRFYQRTPSGSAADVHAKGAWENGCWTVEFSRKLSTGSSDDIRFTTDDPLFLSVFPGPVKDFESFRKLRGTSFILNFAEEKSE